MMFAENIYAASLKNLLQMQSGPNNFSVMNYTKFTGSGFRSYMVNTSNKLLSVGFCTKPVYFS